MNTSEEKLNKLKEKLRELFQLDRGDLDFGLYRVMAYKSCEVGDFLDNHLLPQVSEALGEIAQAGVAAIEQKLDEAIGKAKELKVDPEQSDTVKDLRQQMKTAKADQQAEGDVYSHLYNFFSRYYDEGDFMPLRRYKSTGKEAYHIPYNGEEVKLHWANADQYYIKTTENYASYVFVIGEGDNACRVRFEIASANNEKDNIKEADGKKRRFILAKTDAVATATQGEDLVVRFEHRPLSSGEKQRYGATGDKQQRQLNEAAEKSILAQARKLDSKWQLLLCASAPTEQNSERTLLGKHLATYTAKNSFDYFIHKNLGDFLRLELDFFLKAEVLFTKDLETADANDLAALMRPLSKMKAIKLIGHKIIDFLAQLEDFQKQLWLKKKFVLETQYCITLDRVPSSLYAEIASNKVQHDEWVELFAINKKLPPPPPRARPAVVLIATHSQ